MPLRIRHLAALAVAASLVGGIAGAAEILIPRKQTKPPNKPYSPTEAIAKMTVPEGFSVELCAAEPDLVNPVAMTFDERGRVWVTESLEYPRRAAGPGRDRVKILEDADGDGTFETVKIFAEGLNIPSGIAVGMGGVWVANAPDILFYPDVNRDDVPDGPPQVVVTGFGRDDTHELPNSLTWGPDGYLYGLNGVFNRSVIKQNGRTFDFTCAMFRIDPRTREFGLFCEGTSNPWGIAFNENGDAFVSACVIDHLWHLVETGYYHRQGGPYPPFTWKLGSIVDYKHQMAAYCGIHWFDSDAYPEPYRRKLYMGNVHGGCINVDRLERNGATYKGHAEPDFLTANDAWFMPVVQKTGPDGCLYILDWYDRYHCYQDANADPDGIDRAKGRLYRVRYKQTPRAPKFDLTKETDAQLIERLKSPNIFYRDIAQRLLWERNDPATRGKLEAIALDDSTDHILRMHAFWVLAGTRSLTEATLNELAKRDAEDVRAWAVRAAGNLGIKLSLIDLRDRVLLQRVIAAGKHGRIDELLKLSPRDEFISQIAWSSLRAEIASRPQEFLTKYLRTPDKTMNGEANYQESVNSPSPVVRRIFDVVIGNKDVSYEATAQFVNACLLDHRDTDQKMHTVDLISEKILTGELNAAKLEPLVERALVARIQSNHGQVRYSAIKMGALMGMPGARALLWKFLPRTIDETELKKWCQWREGEYNHVNKDGTWSVVNELRWLIAGRDGLAIEYALHWVGSQAFTLSRRKQILPLFATVNEPIVGRMVVEQYPKLEPELQAQAIELLTQRPEWTRKLLAAIEAKQISADAVNVTQLLRLQTGKDRDIAERSTAIWGKLRTDRNPQREQVVADMRKRLVGSQGDAVRGQAVFAKLCGQCHKLHGQGQDVGPDITVNGRASFEQMLANVFDPSLVINNAYQARTVVTSDGRVLTGLLVEDNPQRVVLKLQGGKLETIARGDVEEMETSKLSLMPEGVEKQLSPQELIDLFALLKLDKPPTDPQAKPLPGFSELK